MEKIKVCNSCSKKFKSLLKNLCKKMKNDTAKNSKS